MRITYNEIINKMKAAYFERCGESVKAFSDTSARLEAAASELFSLACETEFIFRQAFPQSAAGEYLDFHARLRDIHRKQSSKAMGELTFSVIEAAQNDIEIPKGIICSKADEAFVQFITTESAVISAGNTEATVPAEALENGGEYNAPAGTVTVMVNPPAGIDGVTNNNAFSSGSDTESDSSLRERILSSYSIMQSGFTRDSLREGIMRNDDILDCAVNYDSGVITVLLRLKTGADFESIKAEIEDSIAISRLFNCSVVVKNTAPKGYSLIADVKVDDCDKNAVEEAVKAKLIEFAGNVRINRSVLLDEFVFAASSAGGVSHIEVSSPQIEYGVLNCPEEKYLVLNSVQVNCYE